jgi:hypothetical protein
LAEALNWKLERESRTRDSAVTTLRLDLQKNFTKNRIS